MNQQDWDRIYDVLEDELSAPVRRDSARSDPFSVSIALDRTRFAIERDDARTAIEILQRLQGELQTAHGPSNRGGTRSSALQCLEALEDKVHTGFRLGSARQHLDGGVDVVAPGRAASRNAKVIRSTAFSDIADEYVRLFQTARIRSDKRDTVAWYVNKIVASRDLYERIEDRTEVPWWFTGLIHGMECSFSTRKHLHNGDPLGARTTQIPAGRPEHGEPPFSFSESAVDALAHEGFAGQSDWGLAITLYRLERYNGFGYRQRFGTASPYLWSFCNHYESGKYVRDGTYDPEAVSGQCGAVATLHALIEAGNVTLASPQPEPSQSSEVAPPVAPSAGADLPGGTGGSPRLEDHVAPPHAPADVPPPTSATLAAAGLSPAVATALERLIKQSQQQRT